MGHSYYHNQHYDEHFMLNLSAHPWLFHFNLCFSTAFSSLCWNWTHSREHWAGHAGHLISHADQNWWNRLGLLP